MSCRPDRSGITSTFVSSNRSKRSLSVDLKSDAGADVLRKLVETADVFVQNFRRARSSGWASARRT